MQPRLYRSVPPLLHHGLSSGRRGHLGEGRRGELPNELPPVFHRSFHRPKVPQKCFKHVLTKNIMAFENQHAVFFPGSFLELWNDNMMHNHRNETQWKWSFGETIASNATISWAKELVDWGDDFFIQGTCLSEGMAIYFDQGGLNMFESFRLYIIYVFIIWDEFENLFLFFLMAKQTTKLSMSIEKPLKHETLMV